jgi:predicted RNA-binding Zn-ribbon protein involved in translation (DUF1610 family)
VTKNKKKSKNKEQSVEPKENDEQLQEKRKEAYLERSSQILLRSLIKNGNNSEIIPIYESNFGYIYKTAEKAFDEQYSHKDALDFLERLTRLGILEKKFFDTVSTCPYCESTAMTLHYHCPKCKSHNLVKTNLTEHIPCGYIIEKEKYIDGRCPRCNEVLLENEYRNMGRWYMCRDCNEKFEHPNLEIICRKCDKKFTIEESKVLEIPKFALNIKRKNEVMQNVASFKGITKLLQEFTFEVEMPGIITGQKSGIKHQFSLIAKKDIGDEETTIALDHAVSESEVQSSPLILYIYKTSEVNVDIPIFIAIPKLSEKAKKIAQGHQILLIEGSPEDQQTINQIKSEIEHRLIQKTQPPQETPMLPNEKQGKKEENKTMKYKAEIKPQLFSTVSSIHPQKSTNGKKLNRFVSALKKTTKRVKDIS